MASGSNWGGIALRKEWCTVDPYDIWAQFDVARGADEMARPSGTEDDRQRHACQALFADATAEPGERLIEAAVAAIGGCSGAEFSNCAHGFGQVLCGNERAGAQGGVGPHK